MRPLVGDVTPGPDSQTMHVINFWRYVTPNPPNAKALVPKCRSVFERYRLGTPDRPYRGVFCDAGFRPEETDVAMGAFNQQAATLAGA